MSIQMFDVVGLWRQSSDDFNEWRAVTDLPVLYDFFLERLPDFGVWASEFQIDSATFSRTLPTGRLLLPVPVLTLVSAPVERRAYRRYLPIELEASEYARRCEINGRPAPELKQVVPYLSWGAKRFGKKAFIPNENTTAEGIVFNSWSAVDSPEFSRASIFRKFAVLKLGGVSVSNDVSGRNLDFADLDHLVIEGKYHANKQTYVQYSSCRNIRISNANMAFYEFRRCSMGRFSCESSTLYSFGFVECDQLDFSFADSKLRKVRFERCGVSFSFDHCELIDVSYAPAKQARYYSAAAEVYRQLRIAYQSCGKRHEAAEAYYQERSHERKALANPYFELEWEREFPPRRHGQSAREVVTDWRNGTYESRVAARRILDILWFHIRVWLVPRYSLLALKFKFRYLVSLMEALVWGYGERPSRIVSTAIVLLGAYSVAYSALLNSGAGAGTSAIDCMYLSLVTFTTLGYGDITPKTPLMKLACGSEAAIGAFVLGLVVAGFANKSRY
jgi:hypothetical protein